MSVGNVSTKPNIHIVHQKFNHLMDTIGNRFVVTIKKVTINRGGEQHHTKCLGHDFDVSINTLLYSTLNLGDQQPSPYP